MRQGKVGAALEGVLVTPLQVLGDDRGHVMKMLRADDKHFRSFGEIYFSTVHQGVVKAWRRHKEMTLNYAVPVGEIQLVLYDGRSEATSYQSVQEIHLGRSNYQLVTVPPGIWYGFKGLSSETALVANCASIPHDEREIERADIEDGLIPYDWSGV